MTGTAASGRLTSGELDALLRRPVLGRLAVVLPDGYPSVVPVWLDWDGTAAWIVARARSSFVGDIRRDPRVCLSVVADDDPDRRAQLFGRAEIVGEPAALAGRTLEIARRMAMRYEGEAGLDYIERSRHLERVLIRVEPERIVSWGSPEWHERYVTPLATTPRPPATPEEPLVTTLDPHLIRPEFPALALEQDGRPVAYFDGPGGTQVPRRVIDAIADYYVRSNANDGGAFVTSERSDALVAEGHAALADLYGASSPDEIKFGANMTTLTFHLSRSIGATLSPGDEIVVTTLDHEGNVSPWRALAADRGLVVQTIDIHPEDCTLDLADLEAKLSPRTRLVAVGYASNAVGTVNPVAEIVRRAHAVGAWAWVDAVAYAPHGPLDVAALDADFLVTSAYKWYGPHLGAVYGKPAVLDRLPAYKVRPAHDRFETGTQNFEAIAGVGAAVEYLASLGDRFGSVGPGASRRERLVAAMTVIREHELKLHARLVAGVVAIPGAHLWGIADPSRFAAEKVPTVALTIDGIVPRDAAAALGRQGIFAWDGDFYAQALIERLNLAGGGGVLRLGISHYATEAEIDRLLEALEAIAGRRHQPDGAARER